jgi:hypothetical protein
MVGTENGRQNNAAVFRLNNWYSRLESNQRPFAPEANALSTELREHTKLELK